LAIVGKFGLSCFLTSYSAVTCPEYPFFIWGIEICNGMFSHYENITVTIFLIVKMLASIRAI